VRSNSQRRQSSDKPHGEQPHVMHL
jgi:hypothetical protein